MDTNLFKPTSNRRFRVESKKLLVVDPFYFGYSESIESKLDKARCSTTKKKSYVVFPYGALYYTRGSDGVGTDCCVSIFQEEDVITLIMEGDMITTKKRLKQKIRESGGVEEDFRIVNEDLYRKLKQSFRFSATVDICSLLIGDAEKYSLPESEWYFRDNPDISPERKDNYVQRLRDIVKSHYRKNILKVKKGWYWLEYQPKKETLVLRRTD